MTLSRQYNQDAKRLFARFAFELRLSCSWIWIAPPAGAVLVLSVLALSGTPPERYAEAVRETQEIGMPMLGAVLMIPLLETEWSQGTLVQLALHARLIRVLLLRLWSVSGYLASVSVLATLGGLAVAPHIPADGALVSWIANTLLIALPPTLLLGALALLVTHSTLSATSGYLVAGALWLVNVVAGLTLPATSGLRSVLLFGWTFAPTGATVDWRTGKLVLLLAAVVLLAAEAPLLHSEARLARDTAE